MKELNSQNDKLMSDLKVNNKEVDTLKVFLANAKKKARRIVRKIEPRDRRTQEFEEP